MNIVKEVKDDINGIEALADWLGDPGLPVHQMVAEFRSERCATGNDGKPCPLNVEPNWWDRVKTQIALWIRRELELKHGMGLRVANEEKIHMCKSCGCCLRLKVWTPKSHLQKHITKESLEHNPDYCWLRKELL